MADVYISTITLTTTRLRTITITLTLTRLRTLILTSLRGLNGLSGLKKLRIKGLSLNEEASRCKNTIK